MELPDSHEIEVERLAAVFNDTTNSYKFFWLLAILENVKEGKYVMSIDDLAMRMLIRVWFPMHYHRLSFGKQDQLPANVIRVLNRLQIHEDLSPKEILHRLKSANLLYDHLPELKSVSKYVMHRFLTPWFSKELSGKPDQIKNAMILEYSKRPQSFYRIDLLQNCIFLHERWFYYLTKNINFIEGFTHWKLIQYLQRRNPNVPNLIEKLSLPTIRSLRSAREFWSLYHLDCGPITCIYTGESLDMNYSIDHYLPWSFVAHDLLWNLTPTSKKINSSKGNRLPEPIYFKQFTLVHYQAIQSLIERRPKLLQDHVMLLNVGLREMRTFSSDRFFLEMNKRFLPMTQLAKNMGFVEWNHSFYQQ